MRILMTADTVGGVWTYALDLARTLDAWDVEVILATLGAEPTPSQREQVCALRNVELHASNYKLEWMDSPWCDVEESGRWLLALERKYRPDLVHINGFCHGALPFQAPTVAVGHSCVQSWFRAVKGTEAPPEWTTYKQRVSEGLQAADVVVAPTNAFLRELSYLYGPFQTEVAIHNGTAPASGEDQIENAEPYILAAGRLWDEAKNIALLDQVAADISWPVRVAGPQSLWGDGLLQEQNVEMLGALKPASMRRHMEQAAIFASPARYEPFGLAVLEAAASGCALVLSDIPTFREIWGDVATYVPVDDKAAWTRALSHLSEDGNARHAAAKAAQARAAIYTLESFGDSYYRLYQDLIQL